MVLELHHLYNEFGYENYQTIPDVVVIEVDDINSHRCSSTGIVRPSANVNVIENVATYVVKMF
jgi:hypothetical protein